MANGDNEVLYGFWLLFWILVVVFLVISLSVSTGVAVNAYNQEKTRRRRAESACSAAYVQTTDKKGTIGCNDMCEEKTSEPPFYKCVLCDNNSDNK